MAGCGGWDESDRDRGYTQVPQHQQRQSAGSGTEWARSEQKYDSKTGRRERKWDLAIQSRRLQHSTKYFTKHRFNREKLIWTVSIYGKQLTFNTKSNCLKHGNQNQPECLHNIHFLNQGRHSDEMGYSNPQQAGKQFTVNGHVTTRDPQLSSTFYRNRSLKSGDEIDEELLQVQYDISKLKSEISFLFKTQQIQEK